MSKRTDTITQLRSTVQGNVHTQLKSMGVAPKTTEQKIKRAA